MSEERKKSKPIVSSENVVSAKESIGKKIVKSFIADDVNDIKSYLFEEGMNALKNWMLDGLERMWFKEVRGRNRKSGYDREKPSYSSYYNGRKTSSDRREKRENSKDERVDCRNVVLKYREDAEKVVRTLKERIRDEECVSVAELFDLIDVPGDYVDNNWGWKDERDIGIRRVSNGYLIDVAEPVYLNN